MPEKNRARVTYALLYGVFDTAPIYACNAACTSLLNLDLTGRPELTRPTEIARR